MRTALGLWLQPCSACGADVMHFWHTWSACTRCGSLLNSSWPCAALATQQHSTAQAQGPRSTSCSSPPVRCSRILAGQPWSCAVLCCCVASVTHGHPRPWLGTHAGWADSGWQACMAGVRLDWHSMDRVQRHIWPRQEGEGGRAGSAAHHDLAHERRASLLICCSAGGRRSAAQRAVQLMCVKTGPTVQLGLAEGERPAEAVAHGQPDAMLGCCSAGRRRSAAQRVAQCVHV